MAKNTMRIRLKAYEHRILDDSAKKIVEAATKPSVSTVFFCKTTFGVTSTTVTGINAPSSVKTCVIPNFLPNSPFIIDTSIKV